MKSKAIKLVAAVSLLSTTVAAWAAGSCCGDLACCLQMLACCFE